MRHPDSVTLMTAAAVLLAALLPAGCGGGSNVQRYYLINPVQYDAGAEPARPLAIEIIDVHIPQYLERFQIATRSSANRLQYSGLNQWGENLRKNLIRTLGRNLAQSLHTPDVATPLNRSASRPDFRVQLHVEQFERDSDGRVRLLAHWQLSRGVDPEPLGTYAVNLDSTTAVAADDYDAIVAAMEQLYGRLCSEIAARIRASAAQR